MAKRKIYLTLAALIWLAWGARAQESPWYAGLGGGTSFGQATFSSITEEGVRNWGIQGGVFGGYKFSRLVSLEAGFQYGRQSQFNLECCPYWLGTDGTWKATHVLDRDGWYFEDLTVPTRWFKLGLQANFNLLSFIKSNNHWFLDLSPQISAVNTKSTWQGNLSKGQGYHEEVQDANWHFGVGGQLGFAYAFNDLLKLGIYGGVTALTGKRFDMIPTKAHNTNLIWDAGLKLTFSFGKSRKKEAAAVAAAEAAASAEAAHLAAGQAAKEQAAREVAAEAAKEQAARAESERLVREEQSRAAAVEQSALDTAIPSIYFALNESKYEDKYIAGLEQVLSILAEHPDFKLQILGYASKSGSERYNQRLSEQRTEEVLYWFVGHQVSMDRLDGRGCGVDQSASEEEGRRVELKFVK